MCSRLVLLCCAETQCEFGLWRGCDACARDERAQKRAEEAEESEEGSRGQISRALASVSSMLLCVLNCSSSRPACSSRGVHALDLGFVLELQRLHVLAVLVERLVEVAADLAPPRRAVLEVVRLVMVRNLGSW